MRSLQFSIIAFAVLLGSALAFLMGFAVEIVIGILVDAGALALSAFVAFGALGWVLVIKLWRRRGNDPIET